MLLIYRMHKGIVHPCDLCSYAATRKNDLKRHKENKHQDRHLPCQDRHLPCQDCDYVAHSQRNLKRHVIAKHRMVKLPCELCDFVTSRLDSLEQHVRTKHNDLLCQVSTEDRHNCLKLNNPDNADILCPCYRCELALALLDKSVTSEENQSDFIKNESNLHHESSFNEESDHEEGDRVEYPYDYGQFGDFDIKKEPPEEALFPTENVDYLGKPQFFVVARPTRPFFFDPQKSSFFLVARLRE